MFAKRRYSVLILDTALVGIALCLAFLLRFDFSIPPEEITLFWECLAVVFVVKPLVFISLGFYNNLWRYASLQDAVELLKGTVFASILSAFVVLYIRQFAPVPRSIFLLDGLLLFVLIAASRLIWRVYRETYIITKDCCGPRTLIVGAGDAGSLLLKEIRRQPHQPFNVVGLVDDDPEKKGMNLHGVPVLGGTEQLKHLILVHDVKDVIIAMPSANSRIIRTIVDSCKNANINYKILPGIGELIDGTLSISQIKKVEIEDLLGRDPVVLDRTEIGSYLTGKRVLVTGAGGSIGSEICRQILQFKPGKLMLLDQSETPLYEIEKELVVKFPDLLILPLIADVRDREVVDSVFEEFSPEVVFHAAAYKHVPMMEYNPAQAVLNNVFGSRNIADAAHRFHAHNCVMISTDKAVNPTNVMGATKRAAEIYIQALALTSSTKFTTVRFGNVLGSNGSVIPLFKSQIAKGGPVTVTDKRVIRYFMTIPEATQLVLQAGCMVQAGNIMLLDMGEPVRVLDLAEELIRLSGFIPYEEIDIVFTGLRPGEKLLEELLIAGEGVLATSHDKIKMLSPVQVDSTLLKNELNTLFAASRANCVVEIIASLKRLVPEFKPTYTFQGEAPATFQRVRSDLFPDPPGKRGKIIPLHRA
jgi:FlaA1/EpsC-like NDP-sugar epimerase